ncbi:hypothetical protein KAJ41_00460 [Candidatus Parcubacteria bacterium]|nr:hypothetical protein [Candidatus Parcubacteria bacterium]
MKLKNRAIIIGTIWGLLSEVPFIIGVSQGFSCSANIYFKWKILAFPSYFAHIINCQIYGVMDVSTGTILTIFILPIFIGPLSVYGFIKVYQYLKK